MFLDRVRARTGDRLRDHQRGRREPADVPRGPRRAEAATQRFSGARTLLAEVGGGSTSLTLLRHGEPIRSGVYALGSVRLRQQLDLAATQPRAPARAAQALHRQRHRRNPRRDSARTASRTSSRSAATSASRRRRSCGSRRRRPARARFRASRSSRFATRSSGSTTTRWSSASGCRRVEAETLVPALLVYRALLAETAARRVVISRRVAARRHAARLSPSPASRRAPRISSSQVLASAEALGQQYRFDRDARPPRRDAGDAAVRRAAATSTASASASGCCCRSRRCCTTSASTSACARTTSTRSTCSRRRRSSGCPTRRRRSSPTSPAITARALPQKPHLPYVALDRRGPRHREQAGGDPARGQRARRRAPAEGQRRPCSCAATGLDRCELDGSGDMTMEQLAATARTDMFVETFGRQLVILPAGVTS